MPAGWTCAWQIRASPGFSQIFRCKRIEFSRVACLEKNQGLATDLQDRFAEGSNPPVRFGIPLLFRDIGIGEKLIRIEKRVHPKVRRFDSLGRSLEYGR